MNIFVLDRNPKLAAEYHCDKHVVKMTLETAQILSTVLGGPYKPTHKNHPCVKWARESTGNFQWLWSLGMWLGEEYWYRYGGKTHKSAEIISNMRLRSGVCETDGPMTPFVLAMPEHYKGDCPVQAYRDYYRGDKFRFATYTYRPTPDWMR
jgi:hypothetical protein